MCLFRSATTPHLHRALLFTRRVLESILNSCSFCCRICFRMVRQSPFSGTCRLQRHVLNFKWRPRVVLNITDWRQIQGKSGINLVCLCSSKATFRKAIRTSEMVWNRWNRNGFGLQSTSLKVGMRKAEALNESLLELLGLETTYIMLTTFLLINSNIIWSARFCVYVRVCDRAPIHIYYTDVHKFTTPCSFDISSIPLCRSFPSLSDYSSLFSWSQRKTRW